MAILTAILNTLIVLTSLFMICLILIQRGKGGGLAGAFGGVGGSSAFGTKSGDVFTKVTMVVAALWIFMSIILVVLYNQGGQSAWGTDANTTLSREVVPRSSKDKSKVPATGTPKPLPAAPGSPATEKDSGKSPVTVPAIPDTPEPSAKK